VINEHALGPAHPARGSRYEPPVAQFRLACALWEGGGDRKRARAIAIAARVDIVDERAELEAWLAAHR
jgi:hypothetical protein